ncbi:hypothetical protein LX15_005729 [Streptoalloteichus tenebrarius]|uniref:Peptidase S1 domain-containing protein n=1 Tax=Streptoalloteichus tenebrarius (strain ATCC 17920 / DSM 40477 / JCM 4838 / CBS 697.72 / NBRC 16177 / NCIMB 11028 / NRRL B-12390 / A12253. 1 / ISP 5477) TaxID=1933 RepID=A0ABT1I2P7_STRSD|nr:hypothetical protein [Streptoalloteichus tenebrarius]BFF02118.1 hypothetical protein GCM10020241_37930 [Streptoalloteichus tenebrarius]
MRWSWLVPVVCLLAATVSPPPADSALPPGMVEAVRRDLGLSLGEYLAQAEVGARRRPGADVGAGEPTVPSFVPPFLRAGEPIATARDDQLGRCTAGFVLVAGDGTTRLLTSGHCGRPGERVFSGGLAVAEFERVVTDDLDRGGQGDDYAVVRPLLDLPGFRAGVVDHRGGVVRVDGVAEPVVGAPVCKSGRTTGWTCGRVTAVRTRVRSQAPGAAGRVLGVFAHDACTEPGDSGGPVLSGTRAVGITHGGLTGPDGRCPSRTGGADLAVAEPLATDVLPDLAGLRLRTG